VLTIENSNYNRLFKQYGHKVSFFILMPIYKRMGLKLIQLYFILNQFLALQHL